jgi:hypothetical protein
LRLRKLLASESGQILKRIVIFGVVFAFVILVIVEVGPLIWGRFDVSQNADDFANAAANQYRAYHDEGTAVEEVTNKLKLAGYTDEEIRQCAVIFLPQGARVKTAVRVTVVKYANTLITKHINALKKYAKITSTKELNFGENMPQ